MGPKPKMNLKPREVSREQRCVYPGGSLHIRSLEAWFLTKKKGTGDKTSGPCKTNWQVSHTPLKADLWIITSSIKHELEKKEKKLLAGKEKQQKQFFSICPVGRGEKIPEILQACPQNSNLCYLHGSGKLKSRNLT